MKSTKKIDYCITVPDDRDKKYQIFRYPAGEAQVRLLMSEYVKVRSADCIKVTANIRDGEVMELALLTSALDEARKDLPHGRGYRQLILPYLPYARADRTFCNGDSFGLAAFADLINGLQYDHVITWDVHSSAAEKLIRRLIVWTSDELIAKAVKKIGKRDLLVLLPDAGARRYLSLIETLDLHFVFGEKVRDAVTGKLSGFKVPVLGVPYAYKKILIVDDICDGGGTFIGLQKEMQAANYTDASRPSPAYYLFVTHGIFSKGLNELSNCFKKIYTSSSFGEYKNPLVEILK